MNKQFKHIGLMAVLAGTLMAPAFDAKGATPDEMERARTIAAQVYIRYNDDGATYLDGKKPVSINELRNLIGDNNPKDKELLNNFLKAPVSNDYPNWDQEKMADYWSGEFFQSSGLSNTAADTRNRRIKARLLTMPVTSPTTQAAVPEETPTPDAQPQPTEDLGAHPQEVTLGNAPAEASAPVVDTASVVEETVVETTDQGGSNTWLYIVLLIILVAIVIGLVVYAMKAMRNQNKPASPQTPSRSDYESEARVYERRAAAVATGEIENLRRQVADLTRAESDARNHSEQLAARLGAMQLEIQRLTEENMALRAAAARPSATVATPVTPRPAPSVPGSYSLEEDVVAVTPKVAPLKSSGVHLNVGPGDREIFLGRANRNKIFVRADKQLVDGKSIFRLVTSNGVTGSFVVDYSPAIMGWVGMDPETALYGAAEVATFATAPGATRVVTDAPGTAIFEDGCWKVLHPAAVHFE